MNRFNLSAAQLHRAATIKEQVEKLHEELANILGADTPAPAALDGPKRKRTMSAKARALISAAQKKRWAKLKRATAATRAATAKPARKKKFTMSAAAKAAISKAAKARWAKIKAAQKQ